VSWAEPAAWTPVAELILERLSRDVEQWMVLKHHDQLPEVSGDIDLCVPHTEWERTFAVIKSALDELGEFGITYCEHWPHARLMFIAPLPAGDAPARVLQIDFIDGVLWRGVQVAPATELLAGHRTESDVGGIRLPHSSAGLRAALFLTAYAVQASGRLSTEAVEAEGIVSLARADPDGFTRAMQTCHGRVGALAARRFLDGRWSRHLGLVLHARRLLGRPVDHLGLAEAGVTRRSRGHWRRISRDLPGGRAEWMSVHASGHPVVLTRSPRRRRSAPRGLRGHVLLVGPDGVGKSTIANGLMVEAHRRGVTTHHAHWRPRLVMGQADRGNVTTPHAHPPHGSAKSMVKLFALLCDNLVGAVGPWRHARRHGLLVVERGWYDQVIDPLRYRLAASVAPVALVVGRLVPRADLVVLLSADPAVAAARKRELEPAEVERHLDAWTRLAARAGRRVLMLDTEAMDPEACVAAIVRALEPAPESRARSWYRVPIAPRRLGLRVAPGASVEAALSIYEPSNRWARKAAAGNVSLIRRRLARPSAAPLAQLDGLCNQLGLDPDSIGAFRSTADDRFVIGLAAEAELLAFLKVGPLTDTGLRREAEVLDRWRGRPVPPGVPTLRWAGEWEGHFVVATDAVAGRRERDLDVEQVLPVVNQLTTGGVSRLPRVHGDLAPWNVLVTPNGPVLVDWEESRDQPDPMFDLAHFVTQQGAMLHRFAPATAVRLLTEPGSAGWRHLEAVGVAPADAPELLRSYLDRTKRFSTPSGHRYRRLMRDALQ
jgi:hypothetical protein